MKILVKLLLCFALCFALVGGIMAILRPRRQIADAIRRWPALSREAAIARDPGINGGVLVNDPDMVTEAPTIRVAHGDSVYEQFLTITNREVVNFPGALILRMSDEEWWLITEHYKTNVTKMTFIFYGDAIKGSAVPAKK